MEEWTIFSDFCKEKYKASEAPVTFVPSELHKYRAFEEVELVVDKEVIVLSVDAPTRQELQVLQRQVVSQFVR